MTITMYILNMFEAKHFPMMIVKCKM